MNVGESEAKRIGTSFYVKIMDVVRKTTCNCILISAITSNSTLDPNIDAFKNSQRKLGLFLELVHAQ